METKNVEQRLATIEDKMAIKYVVDVFSNLAVVNFPKFYDSGQVRSPAHIFQAFVDTERLWRSTRGVALNSV